MGKGRSPGKWFKNFLLGKKSSSKSNSSKKNDIFVSILLIDIHGYLCSLYIISVYVIKEIMEGRKSHCC